MKNLDMIVDVWLMNHVSKHPGLWGAVTAASLMAVIFALAHAIYG